MSDLISREALRKAFHERIHYFNKSSWDEANSIIDNAPTVEPTFGLFKEMHCAECGKKPQGEWIKDKNPDKDGDYLCISEIGSVYFRRILHFTHDLYQINHYDFRKYRKTKCSGWYDIDSEFDYFEVKDIIAWCELPEMPEEFKG